MGIENEEGTILCAVGVGQKDSCNGDSGGPLFKMENREWKIYGIVSYGKANCGGGAEGDIPAVYANVENYSDWIEKTIDDNTFKNQTSVVSNCAEYEKSATLLCPPP